MRALLSVYDKAGLADLAQGLADLGWELVASGNTAAALESAGIAHRQVSEVTGSPEMLGGRVKTLHPRIHGGILADRSQPSHLRDLEEQDIEPIDLVVCNLYPFTSDPSVELIDVGGPTMVRAAAKNFAHVGIVTTPADYPEVLEELQTAGGLSDATRHRLARAAFAHTAAYDAAIVGWLDGEAAALPPVLHLTLERARELRYGENPHQAGARYRLAGQETWWDGVVQHGGSALSYLNLFDADAAWRLVHELAADSGSAAVTIVKHANPCGAAVAPDLATAYRRALRQADRAVVHFQEWWVRMHAETPAAEIIASGAADAVPAPGVLEAITDADVVLFPPSNPVVSIGTILAVPGIRAAVAAKTVVGVSPIIGGSPVRGMADACLAAIGVATTAAAVGAHYGSGLIDGWLVDDQDKAAADDPALAGIEVRALPVHARPARHHRDRPRGRGPGRRTRTGEGVVGGPAEGTSLHRHPGHRAARGHRRGGPGRAHRRRRPGPACGRHPRRHLQDREQGRGPGRDRLPRAGD